MRINKLEAVSCVQLEDKTRAWGRFEIKNMRYVAVGDNSRMYRKGRATKSVKQILSLSTHFVDRLTTGP